MSSIMSSRPCILCIVPWRRSPSQLPYPLPLSPLRKGRKFLVLCQALWQCYLLFPVSWVAQFHIRSLWEALLLPTVLPSSAPTLWTSLQNTPLSPAQRYVVSLSRIYCLPVSVWFTLTFWFNTKTCRVSFDNPQSKLCLSFWLDPWTWAAGVRLSHPTLLCIKWPTEIFFNQSF